LGGDWHGYDDPGVLVNGKLSGRNPWGISDEIIMGAVKNGPF
jgi:hypothetical protein